MRAVKPKPSVVALHMLVDRDSPLLVIIPSILVSIVLELILNQPSFISSIHL